jgi:DNA polymerase-3 subunit beta
MKLIILKSNLREGLLVVERSVSEGENLPVLKNVLLQAQDTVLKLTTTNLELAIHTTVNAKIIENGGITIPFSTFHTIISNIDSERVTLETKQNTVLVKTDNYEASIQGISEEEFPIIPSIKDQSGYIELSGDTLKNTLQFVSTAAQISEIRPEISGILLDFQSSVIKFTATDSFRLAEKTLFHNNFTTTLTQGVKVILPLKTTTELTRIIKEDEKVRIFLDDNQALFTSNGKRILSRLINGSYPDYEQIIPKKNEIECVVEKDRFINAIKLVSSFSGKVYDIKIKSEEGGNAMRIYSANQYVGENTYTIPVKKTGGDIPETDFNWRYLLDGLKPVTGKEVVFGVNTNNKPATIRQKDDTSYLYIVMPIKTT